MDEDDSNPASTAQANQHALLLLLGIAEVLAGTATVTAAARKLGLPPNRFHAILERVIDSLIETEQPNSGGRQRPTGSPASQQAELRKLRRENARLQKQVEATHQLLTVAGDLLQGRSRPARQPRRAQAGDRSE